MKNIRRIRFATKGLAVMPQKVLTDEPWFRAIVDMVNLGRKLHKQVVVHTHFNHPNELTEITARATNRLFEEGVTVRNQTVLLRGVNDDLDTMRTLVKRMGHINVQPYYIYAHDLVQGVEDLRTTLQTALDLEKNLRGSTAGFNTPNLIVDAPGGGGKRVAASYEVYDRTTGVSIYTAPSVKGDQQFLYFDPVARADGRHRARERGALRPCGARRRSGWRCSARSAAAAASTSTPSTMSWSPTRRARSARSARRSASRRSAPTTSSSGAASCPTTACA
jgi:lysine 2,3-aminomutase